MAPKQGKGCVKDIHNDKMKQALESTLSAADLAEILQSVVIPKKGLHWGFKKGRGEGKPPRVLTAEMPRLGRVLMKFIRGADPSTA